MKEKIPLGLGMGGEDWKVGVRVVVVGSGQRWCVWCLVSVCVRVVCVGGGCGCGDLGRGGGGRWWCCCWCWVVVVVVGEYVAGWGREDAGMMRGWAGGDVMWWCGGGVEAW